MAQGALHRALKPAGDAFNQGPPRAPTVQQRGRAINTRFRPITHRALGPHSRELLIALPMQASPTLVHHYQGADTTHGNLRRLIRVGMSGTPSRRVNPVGEESDRVCG